MTGDGGAVPASGISVELRWEPVSIERIEIRDRDRRLSSEHVAALKSSFALLGGQLQLQPIVLDRELVLIDGAHRLEAAKQSGWSHIAAMIVAGTAHVDRALLEAEANRVRRSLSVLELETVWRTHYEPEVRAAARRRQLEGLRRRPRPDPTNKVVKLVIGISNNDDLEPDALGVPGDSGDSSEPLQVNEPVESLARSAKRITGFSLDTLNKVTQIRRLSTAAGVPVGLQRAAQSGLVKLSAPGVSVESVYRALCHLQQRSQDVETNVEAARILANEAALERMLAETSLLAERLSGSLAEQIYDAACRGQANREMLRATRVSLAHSLATVVAFECNLDGAPVQALRRVGTEVSQLLSSISRSKLNLAARSEAHVHGGVDAVDQSDERLAA